MEAAPPALIVNPHAALKLVQDDGPITAVTVRAPIKRQSLRVTTIEQKDEPEVFGALLIHSVTQGARGPASDLTAAERERLSDIGFLVSPDRVSTPVWFSCDLIDPPNDLIPRRARRTHARADQCSDLVVSSTLRYLGGPPPVIRGSEKFANRFRADRAWVGVEDRGLSVPSVYSYSAESDGPLDQLLPGQPPPENLAPGIRQHLFEAGVLESAAGIARQGEARARQVAAAGTALRDERHVLLRHLISPRQLAAVRRYYRALIAEGLLPFGDAEWPNRYFSSRDPIAHFFHQQLTDLVSELAGERVKPSFPFFALYYPGSELRPHRDREQCEYSMSVLIDYSPEPEDISPWPLYVEPPGATAPIPIGMGIGDGLLYYGREVRHHRDRLAEPQHCSLWFFFYVAEGFSGSLD